LLRFCGPQWSGKSSNAEREHRENSSLDWCGGFAGDRLFRGNEVSEILDWPNRIVKQMSQTSYVAVFLFFGFLIFVTIRGELPQYKSAIFGSGSTTSTNTSAAGAAASSAVLGTLTALPEL